MDVSQKNKIKSKYYKMFKGKIETDIIDMVLLGCEYNDERVYQGLIEMAGETLDVLPPSPNQSKNRDPYPPRAEVLGRLERDGMSPQGISPHYGGRPPPANLFEQISGESPGHSPFISAFPLDSGGASQYPPIGGSRGIYPQLPAPNDILFPTPVNLKFDEKGAPGFLQQQQQQQPSLLPTPGLLPTLDQTPGLLPIPSQPPQQGQLAFQRNMLAFPPDDAPRNIPVLMGGQAQLSESPVKPVPAPRKLPAQNKYEKYRSNQSNYLILMRGLPGSGKSHRAREIAGKSGIICSTDEFFLDKQGRYNFDGSRLPEAHSWNQRKAQESMKQKISPVVIDNTNIEAWQMKPYVADALEFGYEIDIVEMDTAWAFKTNELAVKNNHGVPKNAIERMKDQYQKNVTVQSIKDLLNQQQPNQKQKQNQQQQQKQQQQRNKEKANKTKQEKVVTKQQAAANDTRLGDLYFDKNLNSPSRVNEVAIAKPKAVAMGVSDVAKSPADFRTVADIEAAQFGRSPASSGGRSQSSGNHSGGAKPRNTGEVRDFSGKLLTKKQVMIRKQLYENFPTVEKESLNNVLESCSFNLEAASTFIRSSGVKEDVSPSPTKKDSSSRFVSHSSVKHIPLPTESDEDPFNGSVRSGNSSIELLDEAAGGFSNPPSVKRMGGADQVSPRTKGKLVEIIDSYRDTQVSFRMEPQAQSESVSPKKSYQQDYKSFIEFNLQFLYEAFPDQDKKLCQKWLKRYNGDLIKTCDFLSRFSQVDELPQNEEDITDEDIEMIDLTGRDQDEVEIVEDSDDEEVVEDSDDEEVVEDKTVAGGAGVAVSAPIPAPRKPKVHSRDIFLHDANDGGQSISRDGLTVAIDKSFAVEMKRKFGHDEDFDDENLETDDFVFDLEPEAAQQLYQIWTSSLRAKKRKIDSINKDEELARKFQAEEDNAQIQAQQPQAQAQAQTLSKRSKAKKAKKKRTLEVQTEFNKDQPATLKGTGILSPKSAWHTKNENQLTPIEASGGGNLTVSQVNAREQLHRMFPGVNEDALDQLLEATKYNLDLAAKLVTSNTGAEKNDENLKNDISDPAWQKVVSPPRKKVTQPNSPAAIDIDDDGVYQNMATDNMSYQDLRAEAELYAQQRREYLQKAAEAFQAKNAGTSQYYADQARIYEKRMKEAHFRAAEIMLVRRNKPYMKEQKTIDLHGLHVSEAINALKNFLDNAVKIGRKEITVITGRGNHSKNGVSPIKMAVIKYLKNKNYQYYLDNSGGAIIVRVKKLY